VARRKDDNGDDWERLRSRDRNVGKFILWATVALVGWSFISVMQHETSIAVIQQRLDTMNDEIKTLRSTHNTHKHKEL